MSDVVLHLAQADELTLASAAGRFSDAMSGLEADGPDAHAVLELLRTYA